MPRSQAIGMGDTVDDLYLVRLRTSHGEKKRYFCIDICYCDYIYKLQYRIGQVQHTKLPKTQFVNWVVLLVSVHQHHRPVPETTASYKTLCIIVAECPLVRLI